MSHEKAHEDRDGGGEREGAAGEEQARVEVGACKEQAQVEARLARDPEVGRAQGRRCSLQPWKAMRMHEGARRRQRG